MGYYLPVSVFGVIVLIRLTFGLTSSRLSHRWLLTPTEFAVIAALGLAACGWPGMNFFRTFAGCVALPGYLSSTNPSWGSAGPFSYVPGGDAALAPGHLRAAHELAGYVAGSDSPAAVELRGAMTPAELQTLTQVAVMAPTNADDEDAVRAMLNAVIRRGEFTMAPDASLKLTPPDAEHRVRAALAAAFPSHVATAPRGEGALLAGGSPDSDVLLGLVAAGAGGESSVGRVPWVAWWPTLRLWGGLALLFGLSSLCLAMIVHPQWSHRELLPYPLMRFASELTARDHTSSPAFWWGFGLAAAVHLVNGLHAWFPQWPALPLSFDFTAFHAVVPTAASVPSSGNLFVARVCLSAIAFAYFLPLSVSFSLAGATVGWVVLGALLLSGGVAAENNPMEAGVGTMLRFGAAAAMTAAILYAGRRFYAMLAGAAVGLAARPEVPVYSIWGCRLLLVFSIAAVLWAQHYLGLPLPIGLAMWLLMLMMVLVIGRITAETGAFCFQLAWSPVAILTAATGVASLGPTFFIASALITVVLVGNPREAVMPYLLNGLHLVDRAARRAVAPLARWQAVTLVASFGLALLATLVIQYNLGVSHHDAWGTKVLPARSFDALVRHTQQLDSVGLLQASVAASPVERLGLLSPDTTAWRWAAIGFAATLACAAARLRLAWWPIHPVLFVLLGAEPGMRFAWSFALGWLLKLAVVQLGGARAYHACLPAVIGVIAGELIAALGWLAVGWCWYLATGLTPPPYSVWPA